MCRVETIQAYTRVIILLNVICLARSTAPSTIEYTCSSSGVELKQGIDLSHIVVATGTADNLIYCRPKNKTLTPCTKPQNKNSLTVLYEDETKENIIGGKFAAIYKLTCSYHPSNVTKKSVVFTANKEPSTSYTQDQLLPETFKLNLKTGVTDQDVTTSTAIKIGDTLILQMIVTDLAISPIICYAYPENEANPNITIWKLHTGSDKDTICVNEDSAIIETPKWKKIGGGSHSIQINMFAFRFITSAKVGISCMATVCGKDDTVGCPETCVNPSRRRRDVHIVKKNSSTHTQSSSVSFAVTDIHSSDNSSPGLSVGYMKIATVIVVLVFLV